MKKKCLFLLIIFHMNRENLISQSFVKAKDDKEAGSRTLPASLSLYHFEPMDL